MIETAKKGGCRPTMTLEQATSRLIELRIYKRGETEMVNVPLDEMNDIITSLLAIQKVERSKKFKAIFEMEKVMADIVAVKNGFIHYEAELIYGVFAGLLKYRS